MTQPTDTRAAFNEAIELVNAGHADVALDVCRKALELRADDVTMLALRGAILLKTGDTGAAEKQLRGVIELAPAFAKPHEDLGYLLLESGRAEQAVELLRTATRLEPASEKGWLSLGRALAACGRGEEADAAFERAFELNPERKQLALAAEYQRDGRLDDAERTYRQVLRGNAQNVDAMRLLAAILVSRSRLDEAEPLLSRAIDIAPDYSQAMMDLGRILHEQHRYLEAIELFRRVSAIEPGRPGPHYMLAAALAPVGRTEEALASYRQTLEVRPRHVGALLGIGHTLKTIGRQAEAVEAYRECIRLRPENGESYWSLANLKTYRFSAADRQSMQAAVDRHEELSTQSLVNFLFALGKASEQTGDFESAWKYYSRGNRTQRMLEHYDPVQTETSNDEIIEVFSADFLQREPGGGCADEAPIFVVGLPRSGSTLIEQILASHSMVEGTSELPYLGRVATSLNRNRADGVRYPRAVLELRDRHFRALGEQYLERARVHCREGRPRFIDKMPNNFPTIGLIHKILPKARIIDARRYPLDATFSCYRQLFAKGQTFVYDLSEIGEYYLEYQRMMDHWHAVLPGRVLTVQYEDVVTDPEAQIRRLLEYCGLPWEDACLEFHRTERPVRTASSEQVRRPIYTSAVHYWRNYENYLGELIEVLQPVLPRYARYEAINREAAGTATPPGRE